MKSLFKYFLVLSLFAAISCDREPGVDPVIPDPGSEQPVVDEGTSVLFNLSMPYVAPLTRSIGAGQENTIESLDVFAFKVTGGVETFLYRAIASKAPGNAEGSPSQSFTAKLRAEDYAQRFVLVTNARAKVEALIASRAPGAWAGVNKEDMLGSLIADLGGNDRWRATGASNYTPIPMWGETAAKIVTPATTGISETSIPLLRMLAKVEVEVLTNVTSMFKLKSVHVYNTSTSGRIVPKPGAEYVGADMKAVRASLPPTVSTVVGPLAYTDFTSPGIVDIAMRGAIYLFETAAKNAGNKLAETCIVVGGYYGVDNYETFYRLDFLTQGSSSHIDILRNYRYNFQIKDVKGRGCASVDDAYKGNSSSNNMDVNVIPWNDKDIPIDLPGCDCGVCSNCGKQCNCDQQCTCGNYCNCGDEITITINPPTLDLPHSNGKGSVTVNAKHKNGSEAGNQAWKISSSAPDWLRLSFDPNATFASALGVISGTGSRPVYVIALDNTGLNPRSGEIWLEEPFRKLLSTITQAGNPDAGITITISPPTVNIPYTDGKTGVTVNSKYGNGSDAPNQAWTISSTASSWLRLSFDQNATFANALASISGTGSRPVYIISLENDGPDARTGEIWLVSPTSKLLSTITQAGNPNIGTVSVTVTPPNLQLSGTAQKSSVTVTAKRGSADAPTQEWTISSSENWIRLSLNPNDNFNSATPTCNGTGSQTVYVFVQENTTGAPRTAEIWKSIPWWQVASTVTQDASGGTPTATITVTPDQLPLTSGNTSGALNVSCKNPDNTDAPGQAWTLRSTAPDWMRLALSPTTDFASASATLTSTGSRPVYVIALANTGTTARSGQVYLDAPVSRLVSTVTQEGSGSGGNVTITVTPDQLPVPFGNATSPVTVNSKNDDGTDAPNQPWTIRSTAPDWMRLSFDPNATFASATGTISGTGSKPVYVITQANTGTSARTGQIWLDAPESKLLSTVTQSGNPGAITDNDGAGTPPAGVTPLVGAFWRNNQTGERIFRYDMRGSIANLGAWTAQVYWTDGSWGTNDIVLSKNHMPGKPGSDPNIYTLYPGDAENFQVDGNNQIITGDVVNGWVEFRIGLKSKYTPTANRPVRYAVVLFSYANNTRHQKLYLRQGEEPDYLMHPSDPATINGVLVLNRPAAKMISTFNLTANPIDAEVPRRGAIFVNYPSQSGALWQWANPYNYTSPGTYVGQRWAFNPHRKEDYTGWNKGISTAFWNTLAADHEVSPPGFRRPNDGATSANETAATGATSEFRQTLLQTVKPGYNYASDVANSIYGFYADGFFDRRELETSTSGKPRSTVSPGTKDMACIGRLFFNPLQASQRANASVFLPMTSMRGWDKGQFDSSTIAQGWYWSSSTNTSEWALHLRIYETHASMWRSDKYWAMSIRPVKE